MGPVMYRPQAPLMASFPPNPSQPQAQPPSRFSNPAPAASSHSQSRAKKRALKKWRRSKVPSSEEEESSLASGDTDSDSEAQDSDFGGSGSVAHVKRQKAGKASAGSAAAAVNSGAVSKEEEEQFLKALTKFWQGQGSMGRKMLAKYQPFESIRLTSGMPPFSAYHFWAAVMALGGHSVVSILLFFSSSFSSLSPQLPPPPPPRSSSPAPSIAGLMCASKRLHQISADSTAYAGMACAIPGTAY